MAKKLIKIPGLEPIIPNAVYRREAVKKVRSNAVSVVEAMCMSQHIQVTQKDIIEFLRKAVDDFRRPGGGIKKHSSQWSPLERSIANHSPELESMIHRENTVLQRVFQAMRIPGYDHEPDHRFNLEYGWIPSEVHRDYEAKVSEVRFNFYRRIMNNPEILKQGFGTRWHLATSLTEGKLPELRDQDIRLSVYDSESSPSYCTVAICNDYNEWPVEIRNKVNEVYAALSYNGAVDDVYDLWDDLLESFSIRVLDSMHSIQESTSVPHAGLVGSILQDILRQSARRRYERISNPGQN